MSESLVDQKGGTVPAVADSVLPVDVLPGDVVPGVAGADAGAQRKRWWHAGRQGRHWDAHILLILGGITMLFPFLWQIKLSLSSRAEATATPINWWPETLQWNNYVRVFEQLPFLDQLGVTIAYAVLRTLSELLFCSMAGYAFARMRFGGKKFMFAAMMSILMVPSQVYLIPQYELVQRLGWVDTMMGLVAPGLVSAFGTFLMMQFFRKMPSELDEAARLDGCNPWQVFWKIMFPLSKPALMSLGIITVLGSWNNLLWPLVVINDNAKAPLAVGLAVLQGGFSGTDYPVLMAASVMAMIPVFVLFMLLQRQVINGIAMSGTR